MDAVQSDRRIGDLKKSTFQDLSTVTGCFFLRIHHTADQIRSINNEESSLLGYAGRDDHPADGARYVMIF